MQWSNKTKLKEDFKVSIYLGQNNNNWLQIILVLW
jgi:hypothetical protein